MSKILCFADFFEKTTEMWQLKIKSSALLPVLGQAFDNRRVPVHGPPSWTGHHEPDGEADEAVEEADDTGDVTEPAED